MPTRGRFLENLVTFIQRQCAPTGAVVQSPELFYRNGKQIGEIDITIRGQFGSTSLFVGLECRDRPAGGPQGVPWISEILGKKTLLKVDKMVAVSSTGFVPEAIELAKECGINLFVIDDVTSEEIGHFLCMAEFGICIQHFEVLHIEGQMPEDYLHLQPELGMAQVLNGPRKDLSFDCFINGLIPTVLETWDPQLKHDAIFDGYEFQLTREEPLSLFLKQQTFELQALTVRLKLWRQTQHGKVVLLRMDGAISGGPPSLVGFVKSSFESRELHIFFTIDRLSHTGPSECRIQLLDARGKPFFPVGTPIEVRLFKEDRSWGPRYWTDDAATLETKRRVSVALTLISRAV